MEMKSGKKSTNENRTKYGNRNTDVSVNETGQKLYTSYSEDDEISPRNLKNNDIESRGNAQFKDIEEVN